MNIFARYSIFTSIKGNTSTYKFSNIGLKSTKRYASISKLRKCGLVGLPNVGKSSLFNALVGREAAQSANYPFCTIDPNSALVEVPDERLKILAKIANSSRIVHTQMEFVDIAGLVKGASEGKGLGNQFLSNISSVSSIIHLVRCFEDPSITHVDDTLDPINDITVIENELLQKDIQFMEGARKPPKNIPIDPNSFKKIATTVRDMLYEGLKGIEIRNHFKNEQLEIFDSFKLLTSKPVLICCNVDENNIKGNKLTERVSEWCRENNRLDPIVVAVKLENEIMLYEDNLEERNKLYKQYGMEESALNKIIKSTYDILGLIRFYTVGENEARAWSAVKGSSARECAEQIHSDIAKGLIKAETFSYEDYVSTKGNKSKMRLEAPNYTPQDGDILFFRFKS